MGIGYDINSVKAALQITNYNIELAAQFLIDRFNKYVPIKTVNICIYIACI